MRRVAKLAIIGGAVVVAAVALFALLLWVPATRPAMLSLAARVALWQRGYHLVGGQFTFKKQTLEINGLRIEDDRGELFFTAKDITANIDLAGLVGRSDRQLGVRSVALEAPIVRLIRREDGSWNFATVLHGGGAPASGPARPKKPWRVRIDIARGEVDVVDPQAVIAIGRTLSLAAITASLSLHQGARSGGSAQAMLHTARGSAPVHAGLFEDDRVGF